MNDHIRPAAAIRGEFQADAGRCTCDDSEFVSHDDSFLGFKRRGKAASSVLGAPRPSGIRGLGRSYAATVPLMPGLSTIFGHFILLVVKHLVAIRLPVRAASGD